MFLFFVVYFQMQLSQLLVDKVTVKEEEFTEEELKLRAARYDPYRNLMMEYFEKAKAPKTVEMYKGAFARFKKWAEGMRISVLPAGVDDLMTYLMFVSENTESFGAVKMARYGIAYFHQMGGYPDPTKDPAVTLILEAARRMWAHPVKKARPMTFYIIQVMVDKILGLDIIRTRNFKVSIVEWRTVMNIIVKFCFVARNADVIGLTRQNFTFVRDLLHVHFPHAKNDQYWQGNTTMFEAATQRNYCPVYLLKKYFERLGYDESSKGHFLPKVALKYNKVLKKKEWVAVPEEHISYNACLADRRIVLNKIGLPAKDFTEHSDRGGGASHLFNNGATVEEVQSHGRWKSMVSARKYVQKNEKKEREISRKFFGKK